MPIHTHAIGNKAEAAYRRGDLFEKSRKFMEAWQAFAESKTLAKVLSMKRSAPLMRGKMGQRRFFQW